MIVETHKHGALQRLAGAVLIQEAGGRVSDMFLGNDWLQGQSIIATNGVVHEEIHRHLAPVGQDPWVRHPGKMG